MKIRSIEPTPNPNSMKINMDESLPEGLKRSYVKEHRENAPELLRRILEIPGVKSIYQVTDFITIERNPKFDWQPILTAVAQVFDASLVGTATPQEPLSENQSLGEVRVFVQKYRGIPMQIKLLTETQDRRVALPERFGLAAKQAAQASQQFLQERKWVEQGVRYGEIEEIGNEMLELIEAAYDEQRVHELLSHALAEEADQVIPFEHISSEEVSKQFQDPDWRKRFAALDQLNPTQDDLQLLAQALKDENSSIRRLATVYLGAVGGTDVLPYLFGALKDTAVAVRRAAGDCLSDLGDPGAISPMMEALRDSSKLVRWRAARFLYEVGDATALPALREAANDPEFEVALQAKLAVERIEGGKAASGPVWQQLTRDLPPDSK